MAGAPPGADLADPPRAAASSSAPFAEDVGEAKEKGAAKETPPSRPPQKPAQLWGLSVDVDGALRFTLGPQGQQSQGVEVGSQVTPQDHHHYHNYHNY